MRQHGQALRGIGRALVAAVLAVWLGCGGAAAQVRPEIEPDRPVSLTADEIVYDNATRRLIATGSVQVFYGTRTLTADRIVYDDTTRRISAEGNMVLRDETGATVFADAADLDADLRDGLVAGARAVIGAQGKLAAVEGRRVDARYNALSKAVYSPCKVCAEDPTPLWRIRARRIIHDEQERVIHYENATFDVFGLPIAWLPYFRHPDPTVARASGFLVPSFESSTTFGYAVKVPYFRVIDDHSDLTLTPFVTTDDGPFLIAEYRRAFANGDIRFGGSVGYDDYDGDHGLRGHIDADGAVLLGGDIRAGFNLDIASDDGYLGRYGFSSRDRLTSEIYLRRYRSSGYFDAASVYFQSLRDDEPAGQIPVALPSFDARYDVDEPLFGGTVGIFSAGHVLNRNNGRDTARLSLGADWEREHILPFGLALRGFGAVRGDLFSSRDDGTLSQQTRLRFAPHAGAEARFPLIFEQESGTAHVLEPFVQVVIAPYGGNDPDEIPFEDSLVTEFDETNVIDANHFSGIDNVEEGPRLNLALRYERITDGGLRFDAAVGRVYRLRAVPAFSTGSGLSGAESDFVAAWGASYDDHVSLRHRVRVGDDLTVNRNEFFGAFSLDPVDLEVSYVFLESDPAIGAATDRQEIAAKAGLRLTGNWSVSAQVQRDLELDEFVQAGGALTYENECCSIDLFLRRRFTDQNDVPASTSVGFRIKLLTLGDNRSGG